MHNRTNQLRQKCTRQIFCSCGAAEVDCGERETAKNALSLVTQSR